MVNESGTDLSDGATLDYARTMMGELKGDLNVCRDLMARADSALADLEKSIAALAEVENQIKAEEQKAQIPKAVCVRPVAIDKWEMVLVKLPSCIEATIKDRPEESPVAVRTDHVLLRYDYGIAPNGNGLMVRGGVVVIYTADKLGRIVSVKNMPFKGVTTALHDKHYGVLVEDVRAAVKSLGFELES